MTWFGSFHRLCVLVLSLQRGTQQTSMCCHTLTQAHEIYLPPAPRTYKLKYLGISKRSYRPVAPRSRKKSLDEICFFPTWCMSPMMNSRLIHNGEPCLLRNLTLFLSQEVRICTKFIRQFPNFSHNMYLRLRGFSWTPVLSSHLSPGINTQQNHPLILAPIQHGRWLHQ
jgi:hypothetical protein